MRLGKEAEAFRRGHELGYSEGYAAGRVAGLQDARDERRSAPLSEDQKGNGWVRIDDALREAYRLPTDVSSAYIVRDMSGAIISVLDVK